MKFDLGGKKYAVVAYSCLEKNIPVANSFGCAFYVKEGTDYFAEFVFIFLGSTKNQCNYRPSGSY